jgi:hypothetical protein
VRITAQYQICVARSVWARLIFETRGGDERFDFSCTNPPDAHAQGSKCPADARRREQQKRRREAWKVKRKLLSKARTRRHQAAAIATAVAATRNSCHSSNSSTSSLSSSNYIPSGSNVNCTYSRNNSYASSTAVSTAPHKPVTVATPALAREAPQAA